MFGFQDGSDVIFYYFLSDSYMERYESIQIWRCFYRWTISIYQTCSSFGKICCVCLLECSFAIKVNF